MIILASGSPRRKKLLEQIGIKFNIIKSSCSEDFDDNLTPEEIVKTLSLRKGKDVFLRTDKNDIVISADTIVVLDGKIFGKPKDEADAFNMLRELKGKTHSVLTGLTVIKNGGNITNVCVETKVTFKSISDEEIKKYISSGECSDKAGAYGIQGKGAVLIEKIEGDFYNVVGLPLSKLWDILNESEVSYETS